MRKFTDETRRRLATGWDPRVCTAGEYARQNGVSERAVRNWKSKLRREQDDLVPERHVAVPLQSAADALQTRLLRLEAAVEALRVAVASVHAALGSEPAFGPAASMTETAVESSDAPAVPPATTTPEQCAPATEPTQGRPKKRRNFFSEFM